MHISTEQLFGRSVSKIQAKVIKRETKKKNEKLLLMNVIRTYCIWRHFLLLCLFVLKPLHLNRVLGQMNML